VHIHHDKARKLQIQTTLIPETGREGAEIESLAYIGRSMGVFTSGGDSSGLLNSTS
jgi:hypothetical protein